MEWVNRYGAKFKDLDLSPRSAANHAVLVDDRRGMAWRSSRFCPGCQSI